MRSVAVIALTALLCAVGAGVAGAATARPGPTGDVVPTVPRTAPDQATTIATTDSPGRHAVVGRIVAIRPRGIAVMPRDRKPVIVRVIDGTKVRVDGHRASINDLKVGDIVIAVGRPANGGSLVARAVKVLPNAPG